MDNLQQENRELRRELEELWNHHHHTHLECAFQPACSLHQSSIRPPDNVTRVEANHSPPTVGGPVSTLTFVSTEARLRNNGPRLRSLKRKRPAPPTEAAAGVRESAKPDWQALADQLIIETPTSDQWWQRLDTLGFGATNDAAINFLLGEDASVLFSACVERFGVDDAEADPLISMVENYTYLVNKRVDNNKRAIRLLEIQKFMVHSRLRDLTRILHRRNLTPRYCERLWRSAVYLNTILNGLMIRGWSSRAGDLLLVWTFSSKCREALIQHHSLMTAYLIEKLSSTEYIAPPQARPEWKSLYPPYLLTRAFHKSIGAPRIALLLGYTNVEDLKLLINPWRFFYLPPRSDMTHSMPPRQPRSVPWPVGFGLPFLTIRAAKEEFQHAAQYPDFQKYSVVQFLYEKLRDDKNIARRISDEWISNPENVKRAATAINCDTSQQIKFDPTACCIFRFKRQQPGGEGPYPAEALCSYERPNVVVVLIALENLHSKNGCFMPLESGQDVCIDGNAQVDFPGTGSGLGVFMEGNIVSPSPTNFPSSAR